MGLKYINPIKAYFAVYSAKNESNDKTQNKKGKITPRLLSIRHLNRVQRDGAYVGYLNRQIKIQYDSLNQNEETFCKSLTSSVTMMRKKLDYIIEKNSKIPIKKLDVPILNILRMGIYELIELNSPEYIINEHVQLAKHFKHPGAASYVNAILRHIIRSKEDIIQFKIDLDDEIEKLSILYSHPTWLVEKWVKNFGKENTIKLLEFNNQKPTYSVRIKPSFKNEIHKVMKEINVEITESEYLPGEFYQVKSGFKNILRQDWFKKGYVTIQGEAAGLVIALLDPKPNEKILDCCSAPGGKSLFAFDRMNQQGEITALDIYDKRLQDLISIVKRDNLENNIKCQSLDIREYANKLIENDESLYDRVLADVPCSNTGVLAKKADARWNKSQTYFENSLELQASILTSASKCVRNGGIIVYSTCSIEPEENQNQIYKFLEHNKNFIIDPLKDSQIPNSVITKEGFLLTSPFIHNIDGTFGARLKRLD